MVVFGFLLATAGVAAIIALSMAALFRARALNRRIQEHFDEEETGPKDPYTQLAELMRVQGLVAREIAGEAREALMAKGLTDRQQQVLETIRQAIERQGFPPTIRELQAALAIGSLRGVTIHLDALERKGYISRSATGRSDTGRRLRASRSIRVLAPPAVVTEPENEIVYLPLIVRVAASTGLMAGQNIQEYVPVPRRLLAGAEGGFLARMADDSMTGAHIVQGDLVIVCPQSKSEGGDLVAVRLGQDISIRRFARKGNRIDLVAQNPNYAPRPLRRGDDAAVIGKVVGLIRGY